eukprot:1183107-Prorocentrum_minimum.AAC.2
MGDNFLSVSPKNGCTSALIQHPLERIGSIGRQERWHYKSIRHPDCSRPNVVALPTGWQIDLIDVVVRHQRNHATVGRHVRTSDGLHEATTHIPNKRPSHASTHYSFRDNERTLVKTAPKSYMGGDGFRSCSAASRHQAYYYLGCGHGADVLHPRRVSARVCPQRVEQKHARLAVRALGDDDGRAAGGEEHGLRVVRPQRLLRCVRYAGHCHTAERASLRCPSVVMFSLDFPDDTPARDGCSPRSSHRSSYSAAIDA